MEKEKRKRAAAWCCTVGLAIFAVVVIGLICIQPTQKAEIRTGASFRYEPKTQAAQEAWYDKLSSTLSAELESAEVLARAAAETPAPEEAPPQASPSLEAPTEAPTEAHTEPAEEKTVYQIADRSGAAPKPNQSRYGVSDDPASLQWLLDEAQDVLESQSLLFSTDVQIHKNSQINYYLDETIFAITWKQKLHNAAFTIAEVKLMDPSQFRRFLSGGTFGSGKLLLTTEMAESVNAVVAGSGDFYAYRLPGVAVNEGVVQKCTWGVPDTCFVDYSGNLILVQDHYFADEEEVQTFVDEHDINFSLSFGPVLVKDGEYCCAKNYRIGEVYGRYPRTAICQMDELHYLFVTSNTEDWCPAMLTMYEFAQEIANFGCRQAYALDGGQTATVVMNNRVCNHVNYGSQRLISDIIYFATAKPPEE